MGLNGFDGDMGPPRFELESMAFSNPSVMKGLPEATRINQATLRAPVGNSSLYILFFAFVKKRLSGYPLSTSCSRMFL